MDLMKDNFGNKKRLMNWAWNIQGYSSKIDDIINIRKYIAITMIMKTKKRKDVEQK